MVLKELRVGFAARMIDINIATITRVVPIKDIKTMIQSFNYVKNEIKNARFFIFGPTDEDEEYFLKSAGSLLKG